MLSKLTVKNVALIESAEIEFSEGLNVLSGETGAGKSVILDALNFVLGAKADRTMIRYGTEECFVKAEFLLDENAEAVRTLREMDIDSEGEIVLSRRFFANGKNAVKINGSAVTSAMLKKVTAKLVDVHGQSEHFFLLSEANQLKTLDNVCGEAVAEKKRQLSAALCEYKEKKQTAETLGGNAEERERRMEVLRYAIDEIKTADWKEGEEEELEQKRNKINNLERILSAMKEALECLSSDGGACDAIRQARRAVNAVSTLDEAYAKISERLINVAEEADETAAELSDLAEGLYFDENEAEYVENRLDELRELKRKYGVKEQSELAFLLSEKESEYDSLSGGAAKAEQLQKQIKEILSRVYNLCRELTLLRKNGAQHFCARVVEELKTLNIPHAAFSVRFNEYSQEDAARAGENGLDDISFQFSANAGEPQKPLSKIISGGEMSRFMLAIKTQLSAENGISTYVFDEIDAGISGKTAKAVGEKFAKIAKKTQIIAVSHLAQIACMSDGEFLIEKREEGGKTYTVIRKLSVEEQKEEIVRLLGGEKDENAAYLHAEELLKKAREYKNSL
ncbi:MAG: DNA repair protein RecN [Candidatus Scatosoma sp.]